MTSSTQDRVPRIAGVLMAYRRMSASKLAADLGMSRQRFSERMNGRSKFTLDEVTSMSRLLGVAPAVWFDEPENALNHLCAAPGTEPGGEARNRCSSTKADLLSGSMPFRLSSSPKLMTPELVSLGVA